MARTGPSAFVSIRRAKSASSTAAGVLPSDWPIPALTNRTSSRRPASRVPSARTLPASAISAVSISRLSGYWLASASSCGEALRFVAMTCQPRRHHSCARPSPRPREAPRTSTAGFSVITHPSLPFRAAGRSPATDNGPASRPVPVLAPEPASGLSWLMRARLTATRDIFRPPLFANFFAFLAKFHASRIPLNIRASLMLTTKRCIRRAGRGSLQLPFIPHFQ